METTTNPEAKMTLSAHIANTLNKKAARLQTAGHWDAADRILILALRIGG